MDWKPITELRSVTCHMGSHSVTCHLTQVNVPRLNPSHAKKFTMQCNVMQVLDLPTPEGWKAELTLVVGYILRRFTCPQTVTHPGTNHLIATRPGVEPTTSRSQVQRPNCYTTKPPLNKHEFSKLQCLITLFSMLQQLLLPHPSDVTANFLTCMTVYCCRGGAAYAPRTRTICNLKERS